MSGTVTVVNLFYLRCWPISGNLEMQKYTPPTQSVFFYIDTFTFYVLCKKKKKEEERNSMAIAHV